MRHQASHSNQLKYLARSKVSTHDASPHHIANITEFASRLEECLGGLHDPLDWTSPLDAPLVEIAYARSPEDQLQQHKNHHSANYIINLTEAICKVLYGGKFSMMQFVIFHMFAPSQAAAAEVLFTRLAKGYIEDEGGFSHALAGRSNASAMDVRSLEWSQYLAYAMKHTPLIEALECEVAYLEKQATSHPAANVRAYSPSIIRLNCFECNRN